MKSRLILLLLALLGMILGFQFGDALVQGVLVGQALFLQKLHGLCHNFEIVFREPTLIADAFALGHPRLDVDQFPDGILLGLYLGFAFRICSVFFQTKSSDW